MRLVLRSRSVLRALTLGLLLLAPAAWAGESALDDGVLVAGNTRFAVALYQGIRP